MTDHDDLNTSNWLQIQPQYSWHDESIIEGNRSALRALAAALLKAADSDAAEEQFFAGDGEGYSIKVRRVERPDDMGDTYYVIKEEWKHKRNGA